MACNIRRQFDQGHSKRRTRRGPASSGYLITALLLAEYRNHATATGGPGRVNLKQFWMRRGRRPTPCNLPACTGIR